ncbi:MAG: hypothetical protein IH609_11630 [Dehalococcoidia bacterium]|nr:hypothetical protein [Dehalococcoidia bacterium]
MKLSPAARHWILWAAGGIAIGWLVSVFWWSLLEPAGKDDLRELVIPPGTAALIADGKPVPGIPANLDLGRTRELTITNNDEAEHYIGGALIRPGTTVTIEPVEKDGEVACSFHSAGAIAFTLSERPSIFVTIIPAMMLGLPFGLAFGLSVFVGQRIGMHDESEPHLQGPTSDG